MENQLIRGTDKRINQRQFGFDNILPIDIRERSLRRKHNPPWLRTGQQISQQRTSV